MNCKVVMNFKNWASIAAVTLGLAGSGCFDIPDISAAEIADELGDEIKETVGELLDELCNPPDGSEPHYLCGNFDILGDLCEDYPDILFCSDPEELMKAIAQGYFLICLQDPDHPICYEDSGELPPPEKESSIFIMEDEYAFKTEDEEGQFNTLSGNQISYAMRTIMLSNRTLTEIVITDKFEKETVINGPKIIIATGIIPSEGYVGAISLTSYKTHPMFLGSNDDQEICPNSGIYLSVDSDGDTMTFSGGSDTGEPLIFYKDKEGTVEVESIELKVGETAYAKLPDSSHELSDCPREIIVGNMGNDYFVGDNPANELVPVINNFDDCLMEAYLNGNFPGNYFTTMNGKIRNIQEELPDGRTCQLLFDN